MNSPVRAFVKVVGFGFGNVVLYFDSAKWPIDKVVLHRHDHLSTAIVHTFSCARDARRWWLPKSSNLCIVASTAHLKASLLYPLWGRLLEDGEDGPHWLSARTTLSAWSQTAPRRYPINRRGERPHDRHTRPILLVVSCFRYCICVSHSSISWIWLYTNNINTNNIYNGM